MEKIILFLKGIIIGIGKIIPGVSGSVLALLLGLYDRGIEALQHFTKKENFLFLLCTGSGIFLSILCGSSIILWMLKKWYFRIMLLFCGLIFGTIPVIKKEVSLKTKEKKTIFLCLTLFCILLFSLKTTTTYEFTYTRKDFFYFTLAGFIEAATMIIPGISGTAILMLLGVYEIVMQTWSHLFSVSYISYNIRILLPFATGFLIGFFSITKSMSYFLKYQKEKTYFMIFVFSLSSFLLLIKKTWMAPFQPKDIIIGIPLFIIGFLLSFCFREKEEK